MPSAENAYLFRHAVLRDAAYQLQPPADRAALHALVVLIHEQAYGLPAPAGLSPDERAKPHALDPFAAELAVHADVALANGRSRAGLRDLRRLLMQRAALHAEAQHQSADAARWWLRLAGLERGEARVQCTRRAAMAVYMTGRMDEAQRYFRTMLRQANQQGSATLTAAALAGCGIVDHMRGKVAKAERSYARAIELARSGGDQRLEASTLGNLAMLLAETGRVDEARRVHDEALVLAQASGHAATHAMLLSNRANLLTAQGELEQARTDYERALAIQRELKDRRGEGATLLNLALLFRKTGPDAAVEPAYLQALAIHREIGSRYHEGVAIGNIGMLRYEFSDFAGAHKLLSQAVAIHRDVGNRRFEAVHTRIISFILLRNGELDEARHLWASSEAILAAISDIGELDQGREQMRLACAKAGVSPFD